MADRTPPALWGGLECSVVRVGEEFRNQVEETGHLERLSDLDAIAALGIRTLRYPVVWESIAPDRSDICDWTWTDERFSRLQELGIRPIAGLVHHGSGPRYTSLIDPAFPHLLARHAERVAMRYPWLDLFTPVTSWAELAERTAAEAGLTWRAGPRLVEEAAPLTALTSERGLILPSFESAISRYFRDCEVGWTASSFLEAAE